MPTISTAIGWIVVVGFAATLAVTLLGLIGKVTIERRFMMPLFSAMILEIISAGFFLFYQGSEPRLDPPAAYAFNAQGQPVTVFVEQGGKKVDTLKTPSEGLKEIRRQLEEDEESDLVYIYGKVRDDTVYFGNLDRKSLTDIIGVGEADPLLLYHSGMFLSQPPDNRRNPRRAVRELILFLKEQEQRYEVQQDSSIKQLYHLITYIDSDEDFEFLIDKIKEVRTGFNQDKELCEVYLEYVKTRGGSFNREEQERHRLMALKHAMLYLGSEARSKERAIVERVVELMDIYLRNNAFVRTNNNEIRTAIGNPDSTPSKNTLLALAEELEV